VVGFISRVRTSLKLKQNTETAWNSFSIRTYLNWIKMKLSTFGWNEAPTVGSFVFFQFYFTIRDLLKLKFIHVCVCNTLNCVKPIRCNIESFWSLMGPWYRADLRFNSPQFKLQENGHWASASCGVPVYSTTFTGTHWPSPEDLAQFMNCYFLVILTVIECYSNCKVAFILDHFVCKYNKAGTSKSFVLFCC